MCTKLMRVWPDIAFSVCSVFFFIYHIDNGLRIVQSLRNIAKNMTVFLRENAFERRLHNAGYFVRLMCPQYYILAHLGQIVGDSYGHGAINNYQSFARKQKQTNEQTHTHTPKDHFQCRFQNGSRITHNKVFVLTILFQRQLTISADST